MSSFTYDGAGDGVDGSRCPFLAIGGGRDAKAGSFVLNTSTGLQSITGVGFEPTLVIFIGAQTTLNANRNGAAFHLGVAGTVNQWAGGWSAGDAVAAGTEGRYGIWRDDKCLAAVISGATGPNPPLTFEAELDSMDADGFTIDITDAPDAAYAVAYLALRGGGYHVGTFIADTTTGPQAITGVGFSPSAVFFASPQKTALGVTDSAYISLGAGDDSDGRSIWGGSREGDVRCDSRHHTGEVITHAHDAGSAPGSSLLAQAALQSLDGDGFTLDWVSTDGVARYCSYIAFEDEAAVGEFLFDQAGNDVEVTIPGMVSQPEAVLGFYNMMTTTDTFVPGHSDGISVSDVDGANEFSAAATDVDAPQFSFVRSVSTLRSTRSFAAFRHNSGLSPTLAFQRAVDIQEMEGGALRHHLPLLGVGP